MTPRRGTTFNARRLVLTRQAEDYLKAIYEIEQDGHTAHATARATVDVETGVAAGATAIAQRLGISSASVSGMVRRLAEQGLVAVQRYRGVRLTARGRRMALQMIRRHRILESYLVTKLGVAWDRVHDEAERLEHAASGALIERMAAALGHPAVDPHGAPIPRADGTVDQARLRTMADLAEGASARVARLSDRDPALLRDLGALGVRPGVQLRIVARALRDGALTVVVGRRRRVIGLDAARRVYVLERKG